VKFEKGFGSQCTNHAFVVCMSKISGVFSGEVVPVTMSLLPGAEGEEAERSHRMLPLMLLGTATRSHHVASVLAYRNLLECWSCGIRSKSKIVGLRFLLIFV
jgi:hypothetical protein